MPHFQLEAASEAVGRGWSSQKAASSSSRCLIAGDKGPWPSAEQLLWVFGLCFLGRRVEGHRGGFGNRLV